MKKIFEEYGEGVIALLVGGVIVGLFMQVLILAQQEVSMKKIFEEYGSVIMGVMVVGIFLTIGLAMLAQNGTLHQVVETLEASLCGS